MDAAAVAAFYQAKGYSVREGARVPGLSGNEHKVPLLAEGPLGSLAIFFGDFGGVDGPEMGGARKAARDIGATPVLAADEFSNNDRQVAARLGVVLLDGSMMTEDLPAPTATAPAGTATTSGTAWPGLPLPDPRPRPKQEPEQHPWPASGRIGGRDGPTARAIDIDDLLADTRRAPPVAEPEPEAVPEEPMVAPVAAEQDAETLWRRPRNAANPSGSAPPAQRGSTPKFAWLTADSGAASRGAKANKGDGSGFAVDYDDVVTGKAPRGPRDVADGGGAEADDEADGSTARLGEEPELAPTMDQLDRKQRRDRLQRRIFWALFAFVFLYLLYLWWT